MQRSFNMLKEASHFADIDLVALAPRSKVGSFYASYEEGLLDIEENLKPYCQSISLIPIGARNRTLNKVIQGLKSLVTIKPYDQISLRSRSAKKMVREALLQKQYDVVYIDTIGMFQYVDGKHHSIIVNHHNIESDMLIRRAARRTGFWMKRYFHWQGRLTEKLERCVVARASKNYVCSKLDKDRLQAISRCEVQVVPNGVDTDYFVRSSPYNPDTVNGSIFVGGLSWYPNAEAVSFIVSELLPKVPRGSPAFPVTVCGKGRHKLLETESARNDSIIMAGFVEDVRESMELSALYLCPIMDGGGTKLKVLDALAMGVPLIANPVSCEGIDVVEGEHVVYAETATEFVRAMDELLGDGDRRVRMSVAGRALIEEKYSYEVIGRSMRDSFVSLVQASKNGY